MTLLLTIKVLHFLTTLTFQISAPVERRMRISGESVPLCNIEVEQHGHAARISLWREIALKPIQAGQKLSFTHLTMGEKFPGGLQMAQYHSTLNTTIVEVCHL